MNPIEYRVATGRRPFSPAWRTFVKALYGIPLDADERALFATMSGGRTERPGVGWTEAFANVGRGGGKDDTISSLVAYECRFGGHEIAAAPGQRLPALVVCPLRNQAVGTLRMVKGEANAKLNKRFIDRETTESVEFKNGTVAQVQTADEVAVVGDTLCVLAFNEWALFPGADSANSGKMIEANVRPALRRVRGAPVKRFLKIGSSYIKEGEAWACFRDDFGRDDSDVLVVHGGSTFFNPNLDPAWLASELKKLGPLLYAMHYKCEWQDATVESWFPRECIALSVQWGKASLPHVPDAEVTIATDAGFGDRFGWAAATSVQGPPDPTTGVRGPRRTTVHGCGTYRADSSDPRAVARKLRDEVCVRYGTNKIILDNFSSATFAQLCRDVGLVPHVSNWHSGKAEEGSTDADDYSKVQKYESVRTGMASGDVWFPDVADLVADLRACRGKFLPGGSQKIEVPRTVRGHGDCLSAVILATATVLLGRAQLPNSLLTWWEKREREQNEHDLAMACAGGGGFF